MTAKTRHSSNNTIEVLACASYIKELDRQNSARWRASARHGEQGMKKSGSENLHHSLCSTLWHLSLLQICKNTPHSQVYFNVLNIYFYRKTRKRDLLFLFSDIGFKTSCILNSFSILKKSHQQTIFSLLKRSFKTTIEDNAKNAFFFRVFRCWLKLTQVLIKVITH